MEEIGSYGLVEDIARLFALELVAVHSVPVYQSLLHLIHCVHISVSISPHLVAQSVFVIRRPIRVFHNERMQK